MTQQLQIDLLKAHLRNRGLTILDADGHEASDHEVQDIVELLDDPWLDETTKEIDPNLQKHLVAATAASPLAEG